MNVTDLGTIQEKTTPYFTATLIDDQTDLPITQAQIGTLTLTLYEPVSGAIINGRNAQDCLGGDKSGANNCTFHATSGLLTWKVQQLDSTIQLTARPRERHRAVFRASWTRSGETQHGVYVMEFTVVNEEKVS